MSAAPPPQLIWIDPGGQTGMAWLFKGGANYHFGASEYPFGEACEKLENWCHAWSGQFWIGWEKFTILPGTHKLHPEPEAYEFPGVIKHLARKYRCTLLTPAAPADRNLVLPSELKALNWWVPGKDDAQSAAQHLLAWLKREKCMPPELESKLARARSRTV